MVILHTLERELLKRVKTMQPPPPQKTQNKKQTKKVTNAYGKILQIINVKEYASQYHP